MIKVGVLGAAGRMGSEVCRAVDADPETELVAAVDVAGGGDGSGTGALSRDIAALAQKEAEVAVDFTVADSAVANIRWCISQGISVVVGTTGIERRELDGIAELLGESPRVGVLIAPNFAIGAVLMMKFAELAARWLPSAEIVELHHSGKLDAPSGTALKTAEAIAAARQAAPSEIAGGTEAVTGARGGDVDGVKIHSIRLPGLVAHQEVVFGGLGQTLTIRHDSTDRTSFMPGVLLAVKKIRDTPGLTIGLDKLLGI